MARSRKSTFLIAQFALWGGLLIATLIGTYGPHGPAVHPKMIAMSVALCGGICWFLVRPACSRSVQIAFASLLVIALLTTALVSTAFADQLPPITTAFAMVAFGAVGATIFAVGKIKEPCDEP